MICKRCHAGDIAIQPPDIRFGSSKGSIGIVVREGIGGMCSRTPTAPFGIPKSFAGILGGYAVDNDIPKSL